VSSPIATAADSAAQPATRRATVFELLLVLGLPTALFLAGSFRSLARNNGALYFNDARIASTLVIEAVLVVLLLPLLRRRGWRPADVAGAPEPSDVFRGAGLWFAAMASYYVAWVVFSLAKPEWADLVRAHHITGSLSTTTIVVGAVFNPLFEEFLWLGYAVPALGSRIGLRNAAMVSVALRVAVHAYQGVMALVAILPVGVVLTWYYARTRRLWPAVVAHVILDGLGFAMLARLHP